MEAGKAKIEGKVISLTWVDAMVRPPIRTAPKKSPLSVGVCPDLWFVLGHVHRQLDELPDRGAGPVLPGNGTIVATHADREKLFRRAGRTIVELAKRHYEQDDYSVLPRNIANFKAFENAIALDVAMGGSTNTVLHLLAAAQGSGCGFSMKDIDRMSRKVPCLSKVAPAVPDVHIEDVHRAGGIMSILGELARGGLLHTDVPTVHSATMADAIANWDVTVTQDEAVHTFYKGARRRAHQGGFSQDSRWKALDLDRENGVIRSKGTRLHRRRWLAVLYGNIAEKGCIVKTAGVDESHLEVHRQGPRVRKPGRCGGRHPG